MAQIGHQDDKIKPKYASMRKGQMIDTITLEEALDLFKLPRNLGQHDGKEIIISIGRFGPYIKHGEEYVSLPKTEDPYSISLSRVVEILTSPRLPRTLGQYEGQPVVVAKSFFGNYVKHGATNASLPKRFDTFLVTLEEAIEILKVKIQKDKEKHIKSWPEDRRVKVVIGRYGPYIQSGKKIFKIPAGKEPLELELEECLVIAGIKKGKIKTQVEEKSREQKVKDLPAGLPAEGHGKAGKRKDKPQAPIHKKKTKKKTVAKKSSPMSAKRAMAQGAKKPKLRIIKAKRQFFGKRRR